ncbi:MAG: hypothetical protein PHU25_19350 [Deltaproteobacteria bacterium]|nr:hypothetical protein [Deltaproteobacteria bacterium]
MPALIRAMAAALLLFSAAGCGGGQKEQKTLDTRPLEESRAFEIISQMMQERGFKAVRDVQIELSNQVRFPCDLRAEGQAFCIEYLTDRDRLDIGMVPPPAVGSRLHVLSARTISDDPSVAIEPIYVFFIDDRKFVYQYNPTSDNRADITYQEVESRLRRDVSDFLSWYDSYRVKK